MPPDNKPVTQDPLDVSGIQVDTGGPYVTASATYETIAESVSINVIPPGTYAVLVFGELLNTTNNAEGGFRLVAEGVQVVAGQFQYESGVADVPKAFGLFAGFSVTEPRQPGSLTEFQAFTNAGTLTAQNLSTLFFSLAKRDVIVPVDFTPVP